jgi:DNA-binding transcriptional MerR regulator
MPEDSWLTLSYDSVMFCGMDEPQWTLPELAAEVAAQLARNYEATENGQIRPVPDERSIRYYTSLGLIDRAAAMRGRTALYGRRHLAQVVAIKRFQAVGKSLAEIQRLLPTLDDATLSRASGVVLERGKRARTARTAFWSAPAEAAPEPAPGGGPYRVAPIEIAVTLPLGDGVSLTFTPARALHAADTDGIRRAAASLVAELARRGLIANPDPETATKEEEPR